MTRPYFQLGAGGAAAKLLGGVREILLAHFFGTGRAADAYRGSLSLTLSPVHLITSRVVQTCFVPLYAGYAEKEEEKGVALFQSILVLFLTLGAILGAALYLLAPAVVGIVLKGFDPGRATLTIQMLRIMAVGIPFYVYCSVLGALDTAQKRFIIPSLRPGLQNLGMVVMIVVAARGGAPALAAYGFTGAYVILSVWATLLLLRGNRLPLRPRLEPAVLREVWARLWILVRPLLLLSLLIEGNILVERYVSSLLGPGRVAAVDYARFLTETIHFLLTVPLGIMGLSLFAGISEAEMEAKADRQLSLLLLGLIPVSAFLLLNGRPVLSLVYMRGSFGEASLLLTQRALLGFAAGLSFFSASYLLQRILNARLRNGTVLRAEGLSIGLSVAFNLLLYRHLGVLVVGLAIAVGSLASLVYYLASLRLSLARARRALLPLLAALPLYVVASCAVRTLLGDGAIVLLAQVPLLLLFYAALLLHRDLRGLIQKDAGEVE